MVTQLMIAIDQLLNTLIGGYADETLSSHAYRMWLQKKPWGFLRTVIDALLFFDKDHCLNSYLSERKRMQMPPELRTNNITPT